MNIVNTYTDLEIAANQWKPNMVIVNDIDRCCDLINFPHEDYPEFVPNTKEALLYTIQLLGDGVELTERDIKDIHKIAMNGKPYLSLGVWRGFDVTVSNKLTPPQPYMIPSMMMSILPVGGLNGLDAFLWYKRFETIHPFEDGNGRVGGIILAAMHYIAYKCYMVSAMEFKYTTDRMLSRISDEEDELLNNGKYFDLNKSYGERCLIYISEYSQKNIKFRRILEETSLQDEFDLMVKNGDLNSIRKTLENLSKN